MADLAHVLRYLPSIQDPNLLVGDNPADDAAVYRLRDDLALIQTVDFFTPIVDDPYLYGQIAAANSLSDVYAMGGEPITALNIVGFPVKSLSLEILGEILRGGADKAAEAGVPIIGGHTVDDEEPKYGLAVTGTVHPDRMITARGAQPGDRLFLTKPLGTGVVSTALKAGRALEHHVTQCVLWMCTLNRSASRAMREAGAHAATDITGYGLLGHLIELCRASGVSSAIDVSSIPLLPGALTYAGEGFSPGGAWTNLQHIEDSVTIAASIGQDMRALLVDPQTSGGLLVSLPEAQVEVFTRSVAWDMLAVEIGIVLDGEPGHIDVGEGAIP